MKIILLIIAMLMWFFLIEDNISFLIKYKKGTMVSYKDEVDSIMMCLISLGISSRIIESQISGDNFLIVVITAIFFILLIWRAIIVYRSFRPRF